MTLGLFDEMPAPYRAPEVIAPGAVLLRGFASGMADALVHSAGQVMVAAPLRHCVTPGGRAMSVGMTNCGALGWISSRTGYRYAGTDPLSGRPWPPMPACFVELALRAAAEAGFDDFQPDACLINRYEPGTRLSLHQGPRRKRPGRAHRLGVAGPAGDFPVWRPAAQRPPCPLEAGRWRRGGLGRRFAAGISRYCPAGRRQSPAPGAPAHQPDVSPRGLRKKFRPGADWRGRRRRAQSCIPRKCVRCNAGKSRGRAC